jgi:hypothetical protein
MKVEAVDEAGVQELDLRREHIGGSKEGRVLGD